MKLPRPPLWLFLAIVIPRLLFLIPAFSAPDRFLQSDTPTYQALAHNLWSHGVFSESSEAPWIPEAKYVPGYPLFAGFFTAFLGAPVSFLIAIQLTINFFAVYGLWAWLSTFTSQKKAALGALVFGLDPVILSHASLLAADGLFLLLETLSLIQTWRALQKPETKSWALAGALWGVTCMTKPIALFLPTAFFAVFVLWRKRPWAFLLAAYLLPALWCVRNHVVMNQWSFSNQGGTDILLYTAADVEATQAHELLEDTQKKLTLEITTAHPEGFRNDSEKSAAYGKVAAAILIHHPYLLLRHAIISVSRVLMGTGFEIPLQQWGFSAPYQGITTLSEPHGAGTLFLLRRYPWLIPLLLIYWAVLFALYGAFSLGVLRLWKEAKKAEALSLLGGVLYFIAILSMHVGYYRFRIPLMPFLIAGAAFIPTE